GKEIPKISIDIAELRVPPLIRPEDKFRVVASINGHDVPTNEPIQVAIDITRKGKDKNNKEFTKPIELIAMDEKGNLIEDKRLPLTRADKPTLTLYGTLHSAENFTAKPENRSVKKGDAVTVRDGEHKFNAGLVLQDPLGGEARLRVSGKEVTVPTGSLKITPFPI